MRIRSRQVPGDLPLRATSARQGTRVSDPKQVPNSCRRLSAPPERSLRRYSRDSALWSAPETADKGQVMRRRMRFERGTGKTGGEEGFTIVEVVISIAVLAMVSAPLAGAFWAAIRTAGVAGHRTDGSSIASREIEGMRAVPYAQVGFYADQPGYAAMSPTFEGFTTVSLGATSPRRVGRSADPTPDTGSERATVRARSQSGERVGDRPGQHQLLRAARRRVGERARRELDLRAGLQALERHRRVVRPGGPRTGCARTRSSTRADRGSTRPRWAARRRRPRRRPQSIRARRS